VISMTRLPLGSMRTSSVISFPPFRFGEPEPLHLINVVEVDEDLFAVFVRALQEMRHRSLLANRACFERPEVPRSGAPILIRA
jgi:hypothetical protein